MYGVSLLSPSASMEMDLPYVVLRGDGRASVLLRGPYAECDKATVDI